MTSRSMDIDSALEELGMLSSVTEAHKQYVQENKTDRPLSGTSSGTNHFQIVKLNTDFVSSIGQIMVTKITDDNANTVESVSATDKADLSPSAQNHLDGCCHNDESGPSWRCKNCHSILNCSRSRIFRTRHFPYPAHRRCFTTRQSKTAASTQATKRRSCKYTLGPKQLQVDIDQVSDTLEDLHVSVGGQQ